MLELANASTKAARYIKRENAAFSSLMVKQSRLFLFAVCVNNQMLIWSWEFLLKDAKGKIRSLLWFFELKIRSEKTSNIKSVDFVANSSINGIRNCKHWCITKKNYFIKQNHHFDAFANKFISILDWSRLESLIWCSLAWNIEYSTNRIQF